MPEAFTALLQGFSVALTPLNLLWGFIGVTLGTFIGVLPGVGPALTVAMLMPLTIKLDPTGALIMFAGIYYGAMYGGSTTTILLNTPGESASIATALEGNMMAKRGRAGPALATSAIGSFVAGTIATILVTLLAPLVVELALKFGPAEYFALMIFAFTTVSAVIGSSTSRATQAKSAACAITKPAQWMSSICANRPALTHANAPPWNACSPRSAGSSGPALRHPPDNAS